MNKKGFTLIELVIVIVILGILAAVAVPKFANLSKDAKISVVKGLGGAVSAAKDIVRAKWLIQDNQSADNVTVDGTLIKVYTSDNRTGYPKADGTGILKAVDFDADRFDNDTSGTDTVYFLYKNTTSSDNCYVLYDASVTTSAPVVTIKTDGCK
ncbi:prepilin-type N-terminal cleavage/methylation domain-containing protein [Deferrivibrio essentukiensis]|uniref:prepilin-type N-terminal cleavage/methylation domain-containing protein n=1 Tax=Deferrivibrio essentukiensis TaxID=2880922 RepID=UPI0024185C81|nr:prepilin-type N-terminal cleavage/methylation domain-containing protein [Deferrivibrio essentukiensis]